MSLQRLRPQKAVSRRPLVVPVTAPRFPARNATPSLLVKVELVALIQGEQHAGATVTGTASNLPALHRGIRESVGKLVWWRSVLLPVFDVVEKHYGSKLPNEVPIAPFVPSW